MKKDLENVNDVIFLLDSFYEKVLKDDEIGFIFNEYMSVDIKEHMPIMYNFWDSLLFGSATYKGNAMIKHIELNERVALKRVHFDRWFYLWTTTIDNLFEGPKAEEAKTKARNIKELMFYKISQSQNPNFIQ